MVSFSLEPPPAISNPAAAPSRVWRHLMDKLAKHCWWAHPPAYECTYGQHERIYWVPDLDDPLVLDRHLRLIGELGDRYDGHADLALVDIGSVGLWGE